MSEETTRFGLPFILPGQAQKEVFHNEALTRLDVALHAAVEQVGVSMPPSSPLPGQSWVVGAAAGGDWSGRDHQIASWTDGGWRFVEPVTGMLVWDKGLGLWRYWTGTGWSGGEIPAAALYVGSQKVVGQRQPAVPSPSGGTTIDAEARAAIAALTATLKSHGLID